MPFFLFRNLSKLISEWYPPDFWRSKLKAQENIVLTDVTVGGTTFTVRESKVSSSVFRIRIHWFRIQTKNLRNITAKKFLYIFPWSKIVIYLSLGLHKWRPSYMKSFSPQKRILSTSKHDISYSFFYFLGNFCPPGSGSVFQIRIQIRDTDHHQTKTIGCII